MADENNRPRGREKNVTGEGKGVQRRGEGLNTGKVGEGSARPAGAQQRPSANQQRPSADQQRPVRPSGQRSATRSSGGKLPLFIIALIVLLGGGGGALSGLFGGSTVQQPAQTMPVDQTQTQAQQPASQGNSALQSLGGLTQLSNPFAQQQSSSYMNYGGTSSSAPASNPGSWSNASNNGVLNRNVAAGSRAKFTQLRGGGRDVVTIMVWMCGSDLESRSGMASSDLQEMAQASLSDNVRLIVCTGGARTWHIQGISNTALQIYKVENGSLRRLESNFASGSMTNADNLQSFIKWCSSNYPANRNMLILWDHGGGSLSGYGYDENYQRAGSMSLSQINSALKGAGVKFDMIGFDTCLMATAENALMLSSYGDYLVASEETEPGIGWYYTNWLNDLSSNTSISTLDLGKRICDDFVETCATRCRGQKTTLSVVDLAELSGTMKDAFVDFSASTSELVSSSGYRTVSDARSNTREFSTSSIDQIDLIDFAGNLGTQEARTLANTLLSAIKYNRTGNITKAYGLSIYFPYKKASKVNTAVSIYDDIGLDDEYSECIKNFAGLAASGQIASGSGGMNSPYSMLSGEGSGSYSSDNSAQAILQLLDLFLGGGSGRSIDSDISNEDAARYIAANSFDATKLTWGLYEDRVYRLVLSQDQWDLVKGLDLNMFYDDGTGYIDLGLDNVYDFDSYGNLIGATDGSWLSINDQPVAYYHVSTAEDGDAYTIMGYVPAMLNGEQVRLILIFSDEEPYGYVAGALPVYDGDDEVATAKGLIELQDGDVLDFICDYYGYDGSYLNSYYLGEQMTVRGELKISNTLLGGGTLALYRFTDIYGQHYWTEPIPE